jgi:hypothetical protein
MRIPAVVPAVAAAAALSTPVLATPIYDTFGPLDDATFGGQGIPNDEVAVSNQFYDGDVIITVAMSATQRYANPALTNDGAGTYFATPGSNFGGSGQSTVEGAYWNFNYYMKVEGTNGATPVLVITRSPCYMILIPASILRPDRSAVSMSLTRYSGHPPPGSSLSKVHRT